MNVLLLLPILVPMLTGGVLATMPARAFGVQRVVSVAAALLLLPIAASLVHAAAGGVIHVAEMGNWPAPFGIVLQLDRLSAMMLMLTAVLATASAICASRWA
jgi:multicomponent K+:H+ antiporter subunit D